MLGILADSFSLAAFSRSRALNARPCVRVQEVPAAAGAKRPHWWSRPTTRCIELESL